MGQACEVCGKKPQMGNQVTTRGRAKYLGGVGTKTTGISRRAFKPNLRTVRVTTAAGGHKTMRVCAKCVRSGAVTKTIHASPFKLPGAVDKKAKPVAEAPQAAATKAYTAPEGAKVRKRKRKKGE